MRRETSKGVEILESSKVRKENKSKFHPYEKRNKQRGGNSGKVVKQEKESKSKFHPYEKRNKQRGGNPGK